MVFNVFHRFSCVFGYGQRTSQQFKEALCIHIVITLRTATHALHEQLDHRLSLTCVDAALADYAAHLLVLRDWQYALAPCRRRPRRLLPGYRLWGARLTARQSGALPASVTATSAVSAALRQRGKMGVSWDNALACLRSRLNAKPELDSVCNKGVTAFELRLVRFGHFRHAGCIA